MKPENIFYLVIAVLLNLGCTSLPIQEILMMPTPEIELVGAMDRLNTKKSTPYDGMLYVTNREPDQRKLSKSFYSNKRSGRMRAGLGRVTYSPKNNQSHSLKNFSFGKDRTEQYPLRVESIDEFGVLADIKPFGFFHDPRELDNEQLADSKFTNLINDKLEVSIHKDIYIYVHGFKVVFERPLLVASEFWHHMGYDGVFISYSWPSTPKKLAYFKDVETAHLSGHNLRLLIEYLATETDVGNIHIIGFSAGSRVVMTAMHELALTRQHQTQANIQRDLRIQNLILIGSDYDPQRFAAAVTDGILDLPRHTSIYISETDAALGMSRFVLGESRLGQMIRSDSLSPTVRNWLETADNISFIDATSAEKSNTGNGHAYFRNSPWVSSDLLLTLLSELTPAERGLELKSGDYVWSFPNDYTERLRNTVQQFNDLSIRKK